MQKENLMIDAVILSIIGYTIYLSIKTLSNALHFRKNGIATIGKVVAVKEYGEDRDDYVHLERCITFTTLEGEVIETKDHADLNKYHTNIPVNILYLPENPSECLINDPDVGEIMGKVIIGFAIAIFLSVFLYFTYDIPVNNTGVYDSTIS
jgi:hypothetical protein